MENIENNNNNNEATMEVKQPSKIWIFIKKYKYYVILILLLLISILYHIVSSKILESNFLDEKTTIENTYKIKLDSINSNRLQLTAKTFSWAIRSELLRENSEQVNQFFNDFIKNEDIVKLQFINAENNEIQISTDKKDEGIIDTKYSDLNKQIILQDSISIELATPINGLNTKMGVFVMNVHKLNK